MMLAFAERLLTEAGVATIPLSPFYAVPPSLSVLRLCIAKQDSTLDEAAQRTQRICGSPMKKTTRVNHPPAVELPADNHSVVAPIYQSVKFEFDSLEETERFFRGERPGFFYTRASNPTTRQLELLLAELQGREECLVCASGVGAISQTLLALTKQGDHIICFVETYNPTRYLIRRLLARFGVTHTMLSIEDTAGVEKALAAHKTRLVMFESPTNPVTKIADIAALTRMARSAGALTVMDNTFAGFHQHGRVRSRLVRAQSHEVRLRRRGCDGRCRDRAYAS